MYDCTPVHGFNTIIKAEDHTTVVGLININNESAYRHLLLWCATTDHHSNRTVFVSSDSGKLWHYSKLEQLLCLIPESTAEGGENCPLHHRNSTPNHWDSPGQAVSVEGMQHDYHHHSSQRVLALLSSRRCYRNHPSRTSMLRSSFFPPAVILLNSATWRV